MKTQLASQAKIYVCVQAWGRLRESGVYHLRKNLEIVYAKSRNLVYFGVLKHLKKRERRFHAFPPRNEP